MSNGQLSLFEQGQEAWPGLSDEKIVVALCQEALGQADAQPPVDVEVLASVRGIAKVEPAEQPYAGMLLPSNGLLVVRVRIGDSYERQRFTILHEAGHTFLPGFSETAQFRCGGPATRNEVLSDIAASELLFPRDHFIRDLRDAAADMDGVEALAARYAASIEATALRTVELSDADSALLVFAVGHKPSERDQEGATARLRLKYSHVKGRWPFVRRHKSVDEDSVFERALNGEVIDEVGTLGSLCGGDTEPVRISARRYGKDGRVIALVHRSHHRGGL